MTGYLLSLLGVSLAVALINLLAPESTAGHLRFISSLILVCVLIAPLPSALGKLEGIAGDLGGTADGDTAQDYAEELEEAMDSASRTYFAQTLTRMITDRFSLSDSEIRCAVRWVEEGEQLRPTKVTVILSGSAVWRDPSEIEDFVSSLLGCVCVSAIE